MTRAKLRVVHVINSFEFGGAEAMLCQLLLRCDRTRFEPTAVALIDDLSVAAPITAAGIPLEVIGMRPGVPDPRGLIRLTRTLRRLRPDVVHTWMDHSNLIGGLAAKLARKPPVVWGIHHAHHVPELTKRSTRLTVAACGTLSRSLPTRIVFCSDEGLALYRNAHGFDAARSVTIPNGFDTARFRPDPEARAAVRRELNVADDAPLLGLVARYDPLKDHATFAAAASLLARARPDARFVLCGQGVNDANAALVALLRRHEVADRCTLLGPRRDVPRILAALDVLVSSSVSEAFPLTVGEAMACGVPCAVTDVGDSGRLVGPTGKVVPARDPAALAVACTDLLAMPDAERHRLGAAARERVCEQFDITVVTRQYEAIYADLAATPTAASPSPAAATLPVAAGA